MEIKSLASIREKWTRVTPGRTEDYKIGVQNPKRDWAEETAAGKDNWKAGIEAAAAKGLFEKGVIAAGSKKWQDRALKKGPSRLRKVFTLRARIMKKASSVFMMPFPALILDRVSPKGIPGTSTA